MHTRLALQVAAVPFMWQQFLQHMGSTHRDAQLYVEFAEHVRPTGLEDAHADMVAPARTSHARQSFPFQ